MHFRKLLGTALLCLGLLAIAGPAHADTVDGVTFTLVQADLTGSPGDTLTWNYTVTNSNPDNLLIFLTGVSSTAGSFAGGMADSFVFFPALLSAGGGTATGSLYEFISDPSVTDSFNSGQFDLSVIVDPFNPTTGGTPIDLFADYSATISSSAAIPEPGVLPMLGLGLGLLSCVAFGRKLL